MDFKNRLPIAAIIFGAAIVPFAVHPFRYDSYEGYRTGFLLLLTLLALPFTYNVWSRADRMGKILLGITATISIQMTLSTILSLSPAHSFWGDITRQLGLSTHLVLMSAILLGPWLVPAQVWRWLWLAGMVGAVHVVLEKTGNVNMALFDRPKGIIGWTTFTGPWLMLVGLWAALGFIAYELPKWKQSDTAVVSKSKKRTAPDGTNFQLALYGAGFIIILVGLYVLAARAALIGLGAGAVTAGLAWTAVTRQRIIAVGLGGLAVVGAVALLGLSRVQWEDTSFAENPLFSRIEVDAFRRQVWRDTLILAKDFPTQQNIEGETDPYHSLRPVFGYGLDASEIPFAPYVAADIVVGENTVDRAHNDWLDTLMMLGWGGLLLRIGLFGAAWGIALHRLKLASPLAGVLIAVGAVIGIGLTMDGPFYPLAATLGAVVGLWVWLLIRANFPPDSEREVEWDKKAWMALGVLTAHLVALQFNFPLTSTDWLAWLAVGLLLSPLDAVLPPLKGKSRKGDQQLLTWAWAGLVGALLIRNMLQEQFSDLQIGILLAVTVGAAAILLPLTDWKWWQGLGIIILIFFGYLGYDIMTTPGSSAGWDIVFLLIAVALLVFDISIREFEQPSLSPRLLYGIVIVIALVYWNRDIRSDILLENGLESPDPVTRATFIQQARNLLPWDDTLSLENVRATMVTGVGQNNAEWIAQSPEALAHTYNLNQYDSVLSFFMAAWQLHLSDGATGEAQQTYLAESDRYFAATARLAPNNYTLWREWARFYIDRRNDPVAAYERLQRALMLNPSDAESQALMDRIAPLVQSGN